MTQIRSVLRRVRETLKDVYRAAGQDDILIYAAALAFHIMLSLFPFIFFLIAITAHLNVGDFVDRLMAWSRAVVPREAMQQVIDVVDELRAGESPALISVGAAGAIWAASAGVRSAMTALNRVYNVPQPRKTVKRYLISIAYTLGLTALTLTAVALLFVGPGAARTLEQQLGLGGILSFVWSWLRYPLILAVLVVVSALAYSLLPNGLRFRLITVGSVAAVALWLLTSFGFRLYISNFGRYNLVYGSIGAVIVLLIYLYLCAIALLLGAELNAVTGVRDDIGDQPTVREGSAP